MDIPRVPNGGKKTGGGYGLEGKKNVFLRIYNPTKKQNLLWKRLATRFLIRTFQMSIINKGQSLKYPTVKLLETIFFWLLPSLKREKIEHCDSSNIFHTMTRQAKKKDAKNIV